LRIQISLTAEEEVALAGLVENLPICLGPLKANGAELFADSEEEGRAETARATVRDRDGKGVRLALDEKRSLRLFRQGLSFRQVTIGRIEIALPTRFASGQKVALAYALEPVK
jgi:hypothetical protein